MTKLEITKESITKEEIKQIEKILDVNFLQYGISDEFARFKPNGIYIEGDAIQKLNDAGFTINFINMPDHLLSISKKVEQ